ncbi:MAG: hypothetical protein ACRD0A_13155, partial [Acidimicrobiales bacterium]
AGEAGHRQRRWLTPAVAGFVVAALAVVAVAWRPWAGTSPGTSDTDDPTDAPGGLQLELPDITGTLLHGVVGHRLAVDVVAASMSAGPEPVVETVTRFENRGANDFFVAPTTIRLRADGRLVEPRSPDGTIIPARSQDEIASTFDLAAEPADLVLMVYYDEDVGEIPLRGGTAPDRPPEVRRDAVSVSIGLVKVDVGPAAITTFSDRFVVSVPVVVTNRDQYAINLWSRSFRLLVDGALEAPVTEVNQVVDVNSTGEATFEWDTGFDIAQLVVHIEDRGEVRDIPLTSG